MSTCAFNIWVACRCGLFKEFCHAIGSNLHARRSHRSAKKAVIEKVTKALQEAVDAPVQSVRVCIIEMPSTNWGIGGVSAKDLGR